MASLWEPAFGDLLTVANRPIERNVAINRLDGGDFPQRPPGLWRSMDEAAHIGQAGWSIELTIRRDLHDRGT
jgi:hypothetical protein